ncbi:MAG: hypothetical protein R2856_05390 [Caldilineaceae bacterium]
MDQIHTETTSTEKTDALEASGNGAASVMRARESAMLILRQGNEVGRRWILSRTAPSA